jgi:hypothetical protein
MLAIENIRLLDNVTIPEALTVEVTDSTDEFMNLRVQLNSGSPQLFGIAYRQGNRLHFVTGMSMRDYIKMVRVNQAPAGSNLDELRAATNRSKEVTHGKKIANYLATTACAGLPFIFPSFLVNYGLDWTEDMPKAKLIIFHGHNEALAWPAIFQPPPDGSLPVTDGGHRSQEIDAKFRAGRYGRLAENAISVVFIFEDDRAMYFQDFADCGKAKAIAKSAVSSWDRRDAGNRFGIKLVETNSHLRKLIDATSNSVNLSTNSAKAWSMSALHAAITGVYQGEEVTARDPETNVPTDYSVERVSLFLDACFEHIPMLEAVSDGISPAAFRREERGGCVLLRGVGLAVLTQAYKHAIEQHIAFDVIAEKLGQEIDWHVLKQDAPLMAEGEDAHTYVRHAAHPIWLNMLTMLAGDTKYRLKGDSKAAEKSFTSIRAQIGL